jgi:hypothetical protein
MKASPIAPAANVFICSRLIPVDLRVVSGAGTPKRQVGEQKRNGLKNRDL